MIHEYDVEQENRVKSSVESILENNNEKKTIVKALEDLNSYKEKEWATILIEKCNKKIKEYDKELEKKIENEFAKVETTDDCKKIEKMLNELEPGEFVDKYRTNCNEKIVEFECKNIENSVNKASVRKLKYFLSELKTQFISYKDCQELIEICKKKIFIKRLLRITIAALIVVTTIVVTNIQREKYYQNAIQFVNNKEYLKAYNSFLDLGTYKDSYKQRSSIIKTAKETKYIGSLNYSTNASTNKLLNNNEWTDIIAISCGDHHTIGLKSDGTVVSTGAIADGQCDVQDWTDIIAISCGSYHTIGLKSDGTVVSTGDNTDGQCNVQAWTDIIAISCGSYHTIGLKSDGAVVSTGASADGQCDVQAWTDIIAISCGDSYTIGLKSNGTVVSTGYNSLGQCNVQDWTDIIAISCGYNHTIGLKSDGTVVSTGNNAYGQCDVQDWTDIIAISCGDSYTIGLKSDGTVVITRKGPPVVNNLIGVVDIHCVDNDLYAKLLK